MSNITNPTNVYSAIVKRLKESVNRTDLIANLIAGLYTYIAVNAPNHSTRLEVLSQLNVLLTADEKKEVKF